MAAVPQVNVLRPDVPVELTYVVERMMAKRPGDRFATPADVAKALEPYATDGQSVILARDASFSVKFSAAQASAPTNSFLPQPSTETDKPGKLSSSSIATLPLLSRRRRKKIAISVGLVALAALMAGYWVLRCAANGWMWSIRTAPIFHWPRCLAPCRVSPAIGGSTKHPG